MAYVDDETLRAYLKVQRVDPADDALMLAARDAAEGAINDYTGREFIVASGSSTRTFTSSNGDLLTIPDATSVGLVVVNGTTLGTDEYQLEPLNGRTSSGRQVPYSRIRRWSYWIQPGFAGQAMITITANWGWTAIPPQVVEACKILTKDILANRDVNFGIAGFGDYAVRARANPQVGMLLQPFRSSAAFGIG